MKFWEGSFEPCGEGSDAVSAVAHDGFESGHMVDRFNEFVEDNAVGNIGSSEQS